MSENYFQHSDLVTRILNNQKKIKKSGIPASIGDDKNGNAGNNVSEKFKNDEAKEKITNEKEDVESKVVVVK